MRLCRNGQIKKLQKSRKILKKRLTIPAFQYIMAKLSSEYAAIAQPVERILGKDEVASSNLASSSKKQSSQLGWLFFSLLV